MSEEEFHDESIPAGLEGSMLCNLSEKKIDELYESMLRIERITANLDLAIRGNGTKGINERVRDLEKKRPFPVMMTIRMTMASIITLSAMAATVFLPAIDPAVKTMMYGGGVFILGDSIFTSISGKLSQPQGVNQK